MLDARGVSRYITSRIKKHTSRVIWLSDCSGRACARSAPPLFADLWTTPASRSTSGWRHAR
eukprot:3426992-Heterocapsa_arctica.AAC.1